MVIFKKALLSFVVASSVLGSVSVAFNGQSNMKTTTFVNNTTDELMSCTDYCIVGKQLRMYMTWRGPRFYTTLVVEHNMPDLLVMTARQEEQMPWDIYRNTFSKAITATANAILRNTTPIKSFGGGQSEYAGFGATQSVAFKEAAVVGNPNLFIFELLGSRIPNSGGFQPSNRPPYGIQEAPAWDVSGAVNGVVNGMLSGAGMVSSSIVQAVGGAAVRTYAMTRPKVHTWNVGVRSFVNTFKGEARIDRYACNGDTVPINPYYSSLFDFAQWRTGFPVSDAHKAKTILNPLADDWLKPDSSGLESMAGGEILGDILGVIPYGWSRIYPRTGFVNNADDYKVGTVTAVRAVSVASDSGSTRVRTYSGGGIGKVMWQQVHPTGTQCHYNVTNTINGADNNVAGNYAWNGWRRKKCVLRTRGSKVMDIPFPRICMKSITGGGVRQ